MKCACNLSCERIEARGAHETAAEAAAGSFWSMSGRGGL